MERDVQLCEGSISELEERTGKEYFYCTNYEGSLVPLETVVLNTEGIPLPNLKEQARELLSSMAKENSIDGVIHISYNAAGPAHGIKAYGYAVRQASR